MKHWLMKSEPDTFSWDHLVEKKRSMWDGVRNHMAAGHMKEMKKGDLAFFYHSNIGKEIVGVMRVEKEHYPDPTDETAKFVVVDVVPVKPFKKPVTLAEIKANKKFADMRLVTHSRLSVSPVSDAHWAAICKMGGVTP
jgi:predicted RNA-binding protein with PUA-like domain